MTDRRRILLLLATTSYRADDFLEAAESIGAEVVVGTDHEPILAELSPGGSLHLDFSDVPDSLATIREASDERPFDAVVAAEDEGLLVAAEAARVLGLPHNDPEAVRTARDKHRFRRRTAEQGLPSPEVRLVGLGADPRGVAPDLTYPCVLKPRSLAASRGVVRVDGEAGFVAAFERVARIVREAEPARMAPVDGPELMVETYIPGREVALEGLVEEGRLRTLALFDKPDPMQGPYFEETLFVTPSRHPRAVREEIVETTRRTVEALGLVQGPVHAELRVNEDGVWPLELAPRSIGGRCARILRFGSGLSLEELILRQATDMEVPGREREDAAVGVMMLPVPRAGVLHGVEGAEEVRAMDGITGLDITIRPGGAVEPLPEGNRYLGFLYARGSDPAEVERTLRAAHGRLDIRIGPAKEPAPSG